MEIFTRNFVAIALINLFIMVAYYLLFVISGPYAVEHFQASPDTAGLVAGLMVLGCMAGRFVCGNLVEKQGFSKVLFAGLLLNMASLCLYFFAESLSLLIVIRFLSGIGVGCIGTVTGALVAYIVPPEKLGQGISLFSLSTITALAAGPFLGIFLLRTMSYAELFGLCLGLGGISLCIAFALHSLPGKQMRTEGSGALPGRFFSLVDYIEYKAVPLGLVVMLTGACYGAVQAFLSSYGEHLGLMKAASFFFLVYAAVVFTTRPLTGWLLDTRGENIVIYPALLLLAGGVYLLSQASTSVHLLIAGGLFGLGFGNFQSTAQAVSVRMVPRGRVGQATSTFYILLDLGIGFGPYLLGGMVPLFAYRGLYLACAVITLCAVPLYAWLHGSKVRAT